MRSWGKVEERKLTRKVGQERERQRGTHAKESSMTVEEARVSVHRPAGERKAGPRTETDPGSE